MLKAGGHSTPAANQGRRKQMIAKRMIPWLCLVLLLALAWPAAAVPQSATQVLKANLDKFIAILKDPAYKNGAKQKEQDDKIWEIINQVFDFEGVARRALGRNWRRFSPQERKEFSDLFAKLLANTYIKKIKKGYRDEKVVFTTEEKLRKNKVLVRSKIVRRGGDILVDYNMWNRGQGWRVYDVKVEGVSLVKNYRAQFNDILLNHKPAYLIQRVKEKLAEQEKEKQKKQ